MKHCSFQNLLPPQSSSRENASVLHLLNTDTQGFHVGVKCLLSVGQVLHLHLAVRDTGWVDIVVLMALTIIVFEDFLLGLLRHIELTDRISDLILKLSDGTGELLVAGEMLLGKSLLDLGLTVKSILGLLLFGGKGASNILSNTDGLVVVTDDFLNDLKDFGSGFVSASLKRGFQSVVSLFARLQIVTQLAQIQGVVLDILFQLLGISG